MFASGGCKRPAGVRGLMYRERWSKQQVFFFWDDNPEISYRKLEIQSGVPRATLCLWKKSYLAWKERGSPLPIEGGVLTQDDIQAIGAKVKDQNTQKVDLSNKVDPSKKMEAKKKAGRAIKIVQARLEEVDKVKERHCDVATLLANIVHNQLKLYNHRMVSFHSGAVPTEKEVLAMLEYATRKSKFLTEMARVLEIATNIENMALNIKFVHQLESIENAIHIVEQEGFSVVDLNSPGESPELPELKSAEAIPL